MMTGVTFGRYEIKRELGRGAMGVVYEAHDDGRGMGLALKIMNVPASGGPEARRRQVERFYREFRALAELDHPRVVHVYDKGELNGRHYFSMELVSGTTLKDRIQFQGVLSLPELVRLTSEMCEVLDHLHQRGVVHRDIKPENIMLMPDGTSKLMDFGIAQMATDGDLSSLGGFQGSPAYMSPEQVAGQVVDGRCDIYSLAVTLYEAATGRRAFEGETVAEVTHKVVHEYPPPLAGLPLYFQGALIRAMAKDPTHRYSRAGEMAEDIRVGRMPAMSFSPVAAPAPAHAPPVYLGVPAPITPLSSMPVTPLPAGPLPSAGMASPGGMCRRHPSTAGIAVCSLCGQPMCYTCYLEVPGRGLLCRTCAFGPR
jgi:eukaryotic-like serine/threonine-protein kinase